MKTRLLPTLVGALLAGAIGLTGGAIAAPRVCDDGSRPPCGDDGGAVLPDYGDLIILYRDDSGVPKLDVNSCQQPIAFPDPVYCPFDDLIDVGDALLVPTDPTTCAVDMAHATCTDEADFGRTNLARSSDEVLASQLEDVIINLAIADCTTLDPAGRLVHSRFVGDELVTGTIDSPLQNLAVYKELMLNGTIGVPLPQGATALETAARGFGVAMDKSGEVNIDLLVYLNETLGLTEGATILGSAPLCIDVKEEVAGEMQLVEKCFLDYSSYGYVRQTNFGALPSPAYIPEGAPKDGWFEFLREVPGGYYELAADDIFVTVFQSAPFTQNNIGGFAQTADDTRAVINYMHNWPVPGDAETAVPCMPIPDPTPTYDLSISEMSGLQVPKQIKAGTEGREFTVTVANAGPDAAAGTITVTAVQEAGGDVVVDGNPGPFIFEFEGLLAGMSYATTQFFTIEEPQVRTTITWTATVEPVDIDPYMGNNTVTETSNVN